MLENKNFVQCYNRGCGQLFDPNANDEDKCCHHPGLPVFHDAYKGWSCCNKKSVDFTEFLNIKGCTTSKHSNVKPLEPQKQTLDKDLDKKEIIEVRAPVTGPQLPRPPFESPLTLLEARIADSLKQTVQKSAQISVKADERGMPTAHTRRSFSPGCTTLQEMEIITTHCSKCVIAIGTSCKNGGCNVSYEGPETNNSICTYHPGCPIFHEGLKFWSCCQKRTTDFNNFLSQPGCTSGTHKWVKEGPTAGTVKCRWDWHQTPDYVIVSVYAKNYNPTTSYVKVNPIRLNTKLVFHEENDASFELDLELRGVIDVNRSSAAMLATKVEIKLKKAEPGAWSKIDFPRAEIKKEPVQPVVVPTEEDDAVDLSTVEAIHSMGKVNVSG